ncbi:DUF4124 domain-containing protein [Dyella telluris]|uniref:DUF4124 domain-containing protein n=1 Tax=Dyella telluris TaxID=2763498 RepID=A0A7G8PZS8_9GAMM|nr:DUF4124 domain-containing protein [Dyella telluris]QNK00036.1 DUF4124 domain-containing protein [Dyella telluris]
MKRVWLALLLFLLPLCAMAQDGIHRCIGPDGNPLFTDQPCAALQATPVNTPSPTATAPVTQGTPTTATAPPAITCAGSVSDLRQSMVDAFATRDPNRLAGLMIWNGYGRDAVVADIRSLGSLMQRPLLDIKTSDEDDPPPPATSIGTDAPDDHAAAKPRPGEADQLIVHTAGNDGSGAPHESRFTIVRRSGCLWLRAAG